MRNGVRQMIRLAKEADLDAVTAVFDAIMQHEAETVNYTNWLAGQYPSRRHAAAALAAGTLYVGETETGEVYGSVNLNHEQPPEYEKIPWAFAAAPQETLVIHTLGIHPRFAGQGRGREMVAFAEEEARRQGCTVVRLDTYEGNLPAAAFYHALGYRTAGKTLFHFQQLIWETLLCLEKRL